MSAVLKPKIAEEERARRRAAVDFARGSVRFEGITLSPDIEAINERYINGEISTDEHVALCQQSIRDEIARNG